VIATYFVRYVLLILLC